MYKFKMLITKLIVLLLTLTVSEVVHAVYLSIGTSDTNAIHQVGYRDNEYHPILHRGLRTVADIHSDVSGVSSFFGYWNRIGQAAVYGSDFSVSSGPGSITPDGVEPMAFVDVSTINSISSAQAYIEVDHRVIVNAVNVPPQFIDIINETNAVSVKLKARGAAKRYSIADTFYGGFGIMEQEGGALDLMLYFNHTMTSELYIELERELKFTVNPTNNQQEKLYTIWARASIMVSGPTGDQSIRARGSAAIDPLLQIDPDWIIPELVGSGFDPHGVNYFVVQQESLVNPGEWVEVRRDWENVMTSDFDNDGDVDGQDLSLFMSAYQSGHSDADLSLDEVIDSDDIEQFAQTFGFNN